MRGGSFNNSGNRRSGNVSVPESPSFTVDVQECERSCSNAGNRHSGDMGIPESPSFIVDVQECERSSSNAGNRHSGDVGVPESTPFDVGDRKPEAGWDADIPPNLFSALVASTPLAVTLPPAPNTIELMPISSDESEDVEDGGPSDDVGMNVHGEHAAELDTEDAVLRIGVVDEVGRLGRTLSGREAFGVDPVGTSRE